MFKKRPMPSGPNAREFHTTIVTAHGDDPAKVATLAQLLSPLANVSRTVIEGDEHAFFDIAMSIAPSDIPPTGLAAAQRTKARRTRMRAFQQAVMQALQDLLHDNVQPEVNCSKGNLIRIASDIADSSDIVVLLGHPKLSAILGLRGPVLGKLLIKSKIATMFCPDTTACRRIIIPNTNIDVGLHAEQTLKHLAESFGVPICRLTIGTSDGTKQQPPTSSEQELYELLESHGSDDDLAIAKSLGIWLVVPRGVILGFCRFRTLRSMLRNWKGNCLVLP